MQNDGLSTTSTRRVRTCVTIYVRNNRRHKLHFRQIWDENNDMDSLIHHLLFENEGRKRKNKKLPNSVNKMGFIHLDGILYCHSSKRIIRKQLTYDRQLFGYHIHGYQCFLF